MEFINDAFQLCMERDANRCRHCGTTENLDVHQLVKRDGRLTWQLSNLVTLCDKCYFEASNDLEEREKDGRIGVMLCGGRGTRLFPLTKFQNKHSLPIGLIPMIFYPLKTLRSLGVYRVLIVVDRDGADQTIAMLGSGKEFGMDISYKVQEGAGGISEALYLAKDFMREKGEELICILGDNIFDSNEIDADLDFGMHGGLDIKYKAHVYLNKVENPEDYGVAVIDEDTNLVSKIIEKPKEFVSDMAVVGLYAYTREVFDIIEGVEPSERGELEISAVNDYYASRGQLAYKVVKGYWADCGGSIQRYAEASMYGAKQASVSAEEIDNFRSVVFDDK